MFANTLPPTQALLALLGFAALTGLMFLFVKVLTLKMSGWKAIAGRFPMRDVNFTGDRYKHQSGVVGNMDCTRGFTIRLAHEGVSLAPSFARHMPCLIPWSAIRRVAVSDLSLCVTVDYERPFEFFLPTDALPSVQSWIPSGLIEQTGDPLEVVKAAIKEGKQPRWMSAIVSGAVRLTEKEYEKKKQSRKERHGDGD